jgi:hypothetical protein
MKLNLTQALEIGLQLQQGDRDESVLHVTDLAHTIGEGCPRQLWLRVVKGAKKKPLTAGKMLMFWHGHRIHEDLTGLLKAGLPREWVISEVEFPMSYDGIYGTCDALIVNQDNGDGWIVDYKSLRGGAFDYLDHNGEPKPSHRLQVQTYWYILRKAKLFSADGAKVLYADREGQNWAREFDVERNDTFVADRIIAAKHLIAQTDAPPMLEPIIDIKGNKGPDSVKIKQPWQCDYCDYQDVSCHGALPYEFRNLGIIGHFDGDSFKAKADTPAAIIDLVEPRLHELIIPF